MTIFVRPTTETDKPALANLLHAVWNGDAGATGYHGGGRLPGLVAEVGGQVVGYAHAGKRRLHPTHTYVGVHVHPDWRGQGIGGRLWQAVTAGLAGSLKTATYSQNTDTVQFLQQRGLSVSVQTQQPTLELSRLDGAEVGRWVAQAQVAGFELLPMTALLDSVLLDTADLTALHDAVYFQSHRHDPPAAGVLEAEDYLGDDLQPAWLYVARRPGAVRGGVLAGVSSVRLTDNPQAGDLGWFGTSPDFASAGELLTRALTGLALQAAARDGLCWVSAELDSPDPNATQLWRTLPWQAGLVWLTFTGRITSLI